MLYQGIPEALMRAGATYKYDLSLPVDKIYDLVEEMRNRLGEGIYHLSLRYIKVVPGKF